MDLADTRRLQDTWKSAIRPTVAWQNKCGMDAKEKGFLTTPFGRKRWFWTSSYYTEALSFLPQSTAADVIFRSMIGLMYERVNWPKSMAMNIAPIVEPLSKPARLLLQVHDSLIFECPTEMVDQLVEVVTRVMTQPWPELGGMSIPIGIKIGESWGD
jgi:DNA polymerase I-like protein with 3'-5' exonuclease and polymerase domains